MNCTGDCLVFFLNLKNYLILFIIFYTSIFYVRGKLVIRKKFINYTKSHREY